VDKKLVTRICFLLNHVDVVGVGGYLTGGGLSFLSTQYGMAADVSLVLSLVRSAKLTKE
jgi:hypothetical protein